MENLLTHIEINPGVCHGKPVIKGTRMMVQSILEYMAGGSSVDDILISFPDLNQLDIQACLQFASLTMKNQSLVIID